MDRFNSRTRSCTVAGCGGQLRASSGQFESPGYPVAYPHNAECLWTIEVPTGSSIELTLVDTDIENHPACDYDIVEVFGGLDTTSPSLARVCNSLSSSQILTSTGNHMLVKFTSDINTAGRGFRATYRSVPGGLLYLFHCCTNFGVSRWHNKEHLNRNFANASMFGVWIDTEWKLFEIKVVEARSQRLKV